MTEPAKLHATWQNPLASEFSSKYMTDLRNFLAKEKADGKQIFPRSDQYYRALELTPLDRVRVVILGQDPYHGPGQAHGLCFSVQPGVRTPPSLVNVFKELETDLGLPRPGHGLLEHWAQQGVLLLNSVLTVERARAASHRGKGWEQFTDAVIRLIAEKTQPVVFLLWGSYAQKKASFVQDIEQGGRHLVLKAPHPSPLSAYNGFFGCQHFSKANAFLKEHGMAPIDWSLPDTSLPMHSYWDD